MYLPNGTLRRLIKAEEAAKSCNEADCCKSRMFINKRLLPQRVACMLQHEPAIWFSLRTDLSDSFSSDLQLFSADSWHGAAYSDLSRCNDVILGAASSPHGGPQQYISLSAPREVQSVNIIDCYCIVYRMCCGSALEVRCYECRG